MKLKILSVNFPIEGAGIENCDGIHTAPSFSDYDAVIIDPRDIPDFSWEERSQFDFLYNKKEELESLLKITKGIVVCILRTGGNNLGLINRYSWLPVDFPVISRKGKETKLVNKHHPFNQYLNAFKDSLYFEAVLLPSSRKFMPIATNKVGEFIAVEDSFGEGKLIFLPPTNNPDPKKVGGVLIDCIRGSLEWSAPSWKPDWLSAYSLPGEAEITTAINELDDKISEIEKSKKEFEAEHDRRGMLKSLLYEQGKYGLEPAVREAFRVLGFNVLNPEDYDEEYDILSREGDLTVIGEIEGSENLIDIGKYRQLLDYVDREETSNDQKVKGILVGNGLIKKKPEDRGEQFTEPVIRGCKARGFCRITTYELYRTVDAVLSGAIQNEDAKRELLNCDDEFKLSGILEREGTFCDN